MRHRLSIIIPTCNSEKTIKYTLQSILAQGHKKTETVIVDCYSKDRTMSIVNEFSRILNIRVLRSKARPLMARLLGVRNSEGDIIFFVDSDQVITANAFDHIIKLIDKNYNVLILEERSLFTRKTLSSYLINQHRASLHTLLEKGKMISIYPRVFKREIIEPIIDLIIRRRMFNCLYNVHTFDDRIIFELVKIIHKDKLRIGVVRNALYHIEPNTLAELFRKYINYGKNVKQCITIATTHRGICKDLLEVIITKLSLLLIKSDFKSLINVLVNPVFIAKYVAFLLGEIS